MAGDDAGGVLGTGPLLACAVAAGATAVAAPLLAAAAHPAANYGVRFPLLTRAAFGVEGAKALVSARRLVCSGLCALHFLAGADALHVLSATLAPGSTFWETAPGRARFATCWHGWRRAPRARRSAARLS